ncbi:MAG: hypothetical protein NZ554_10825 [Bryobacteraceae bacterium]|nr:hypothetical protein [Bryobacteraceae bacterium]
MHRAATMLAALACWAQAADPLAIVRPLPPTQATLAELVAAGALPRSLLERQGQDEADRADEAVLRRTLYGTLALEELSEELGRQMLSAAERRFARRQARVDAAKKLVEEGALPRLALTPLLEELDRARRELDLARGRIRLLEELAEMARAEATEASVSSFPPAALAPPIERFDGPAAFHGGLLRVLALDFELHFGRSLPISANGATALHRALGLDHRGRVDVALHPDSPEGVWLREYLRQRGIPYYAFRGPVRGRSTGAHIHIGPPSEPLRAGGG